MAKGIIYIMTTAVPGLIKIGKTNTANYKERMYGLEHNGYRNVTALKRAFAIEVDNYDEKETLLQNIFAKSQLGNTELFALDVNIAIQLLSSFEGIVIYPQTETKSEIFSEAADSDSGHLIPDGTYILKRKRQKDGVEINVKASIKDGEWILCKDSRITKETNNDESRKTKTFRAQLNVDTNGVLLEDFNLGEVSPSCAASVVFGGPINGWTWWKNSEDKSIDIYRSKTNKN